MPQLFADISMSLDGFVAGRDPSLDDPLGKGGEQLHEWALGTAAWREPHGLEGGEAGGDSERIARTIARTGATIMGRRMFSGGAGPWEDDPNPDAWWGDDPPFHHPVFVLTHHEREPLVKEGGTTFTFVTDGIESALSQRRRPPANSMSQWPAAPMPSSSTFGQVFSRNSTSTWRQYCSGMGGGCSRASTQCHSKPGASPPRRAAWHT